MTMLIFAVFAFLAPAVLCTTENKWISYTSPDNDHRQNVKILNGEVANEGEVPYAARLQYVFSEPCGVVIIADNWALTLAGCCDTHPTDLATIFYGSVDTNGTKGSTIGILQTINNPNYIAGAYIGDVCLIQLNGTVEFSDNVQPATLPSAPLEDGAVTIVAGWGNTYPVYDYVGTNILQILRRAVSQPKWKCDTYGPTNEDTQRCVYPNNNGDACRGDFGSVVAIDGVAQGLINALQQFCGGGFPINYIDLSFFVDWIVETLGEDAKKLKIK